ncbi:uncharacterized protein [Aegilops tauschii subsp. strangulata]|uniref:uncharacterized protein n=1 Tax=Aegilops tauschii subsp. strangulata TaxID=200361 RepID=UPI00098A1F3B|nr:uncharacterized protein LOC109783398 [Aegilops tauschii subsp. strangulata]
MMSIQEEFEKAEEHVLNFKGSIKGWRVIPRDRIASARFLFTDYFATVPTFHETFFRRRYRMSRNLFLQVVEGVEKADYDFKLRKDCCGKLSFSPMQKCTVALRMLAYGKAADAIDAEILMGETTVLKTKVQFAHTAVKVFIPEYLREPTVEHIEKLMAIGEARRFPDTLGSVDCMHLQRKNSPIGLRGQYQGHVQEATVILEAVSSHDLCEFGMLSLARQVRAMTSMCSNDLLCSKDSVMAKPHRATIPSTDRTTP